MAKVEIIEVEGFKILQVQSRPPCLEAKVIFDKNYVSQKLLFMIMDITNHYGISCSAPQFAELPEDSSMTFTIRLVMPSFRSKDTALKRFIECLYELQEFGDYFASQLDFSILDISMFSDMDLETFYPEQIAALKDQHYGGDWENFYNSLADEERLEEAEIVKKCIEFEHINDKDIGLVGHKLGYMLNMLDEGIGSNFIVN